jgi:hypothetical protein
MPLNLKEWYLAEIYSRIVAPLGADRAAMTLVELREHLDESEAEFLERGVTLRQAEHAAMDRLGNPAILARKFVSSAPEHLVLKVSIAMALMIAVGCFASLHQARYAFLVGLCAPVLAVFFGMWLKRTLNVWVLVVAGFFVYGFGISQESNFIRIDEVGLMTYTTAHDRYLVMKESDRRFRETEASAARQWREAMRTATTSGTIPVTKLEYRLLRQSMYKNDAPRSMVGSMFDPSSYVPVIVSNSVNRTDLRKYIQTQLINVHSYQNGRRRWLSKFEVELNTGRLDRVAGAWVPTLSSVLLWVVGSYLLEAISAITTTLLVTRRRRLMA